MQFNFWMGQNEKFHMSDSIPNKTELWKLPYKYTSYGCRGLYFLLKSCFFLKPIIQELFFYKNANVVFIGKSEFFLNSFRLLQKPLVFGRGVGKHREPKSQN